MVLFSAMDMGPPVDGFGISLYQSLPGLCIEQMNPPRIDRQMAGLVRPRSHPLAKDTDDLPIADSKHHLGLRSHGFDHDDCRRRPRVGPRDVLRAQTV